MVHFRGLKTIFVLGFNTTCRQALVLVTFEKPKIGKTSNNFYGGKSFGAIKRNTRVKHTAEPVYTFLQVSSLILELWGAFRQKDLGHQACGAFCLWQKSVTDRLSKISGHSIK